MKLKVHRYATIYNKYIIQLTFQNSFYFSQKIYEKHMQKQ